MTGSKDVRELAAKHGIALEFTDARGVVVQTDTEVLQNLLDSMGVGTDRHASPSVSALPPCLVRKANEGAVAIPLPSGDHSNTVAWHLAMEDGTSRSGDALVRRDPTSQKAEFTLADVPYGYHQLEISGFGGATSLIVTPGQCWLPEHFAVGQKSWGVSLQLYLLRSQRNWGIGDFSDLARLSQKLGVQGCDIVGLNPLHQMFLDEPEQASPYSPTDRQFLNVLNIDVESVPEFVQSNEVQALLRSPEFKKSMAQCRAAPAVNYALTNALKIKALRVAHKSFLTAATAERRADFDNFVVSAGEPLRRSSLFQALRLHFGGQDGRSASPETWPDGLRSAKSSDVPKFASSHENEVGFLNWLQWIADRQLKAAADSAASAGMRIGLYRDLAVGCDRGGSELWSDPDAFLKGAMVGAPPDVLNPTGQNWGLPPFNPVALTERGYQPFINLIRANMRYAGGVRIDHVMGLQRLYCIPEGLKAGAYVSYPIDDLVGILALESHRHRCLVVGEDLGTVPEGFRERMANANILSYCVTFFEQAEGGAYIPPDQYPRLSVAVAGSHDLPTLKSWLHGSDIDLRHSLGLYPSDEETETQREYRAAQKSGIFRALGMKDAADDQLFADAVHQFLARTRSLLVVTQLDDLLGEADPVNVPGTSTEHANWRRKYSVELETLFDSPSVKHALARLAEDRKGAAGNNHTTESSRREGVLKQGGHR